MNLAEMGQVDLTHIDMNLVKKFRDAEEKVAGERGRFALFVLCERDDTPGQWDIIASAPWLTTDRAGIAELVNLLGSEMSFIDWLPIARLVPLLPSDDLVHATTALYDTEHQIISLPYTSFGGVRVRQTYLITANPLLAVTADAAAEDFTRNMVNNTPSPSPSLQKPILSEKAA